MLVSGFVHKSFENQTFYVCIKVLKPLIVHWLLIFKELIDTVLQMQKSFSTSYLPQDGSET